MLSMVSSFFDSAVLSAQTAGVCIPSNTAKIVNNKVDFLIIFLLPIYNNWQYTLSALFIQYKQYFNVQRSWRNNRLKADLQTLVLTISRLPGQSTKSTATPSGPATAIQDVPGRFPSK